MDEEKKKEGVSVKELEGYAKKNRFEVFFTLLFVISCLFSFIFWGPMYSVFTLAIGGLLSIWLPAKVEAFAGKMAGTVLHKEGTTQLIVGAAALIVAIFVAPLIFLLFGLHAGKSMIGLAKTSSNP